MKSKTHLFYSILSVILFLSGCIPETKNIETEPQNSKTHSESNKASNIESVTYEIDTSAGEELENTSNISAEMYHKDNLEPDLKTETLFEGNSAELLQKLNVKNASIQAVPEGLEISLSANKEASLEIKGEWDLHEWVFLSFKIINLSKHTVRFDPIISGEVYKTTGSLDHIGWVKPGETRLFNCPIISDYSTRKKVYAQMDKNFPNMRGMPDGISFGRTFDVTKTRSIKIDFLANENNSTVILSKILKRKASTPELYTKKTNIFFPFIDKYSQYKHGDWPGKVKNDAQLKAEIKIEEQDAAKYEGSAEWNRYGGFKNGPKLEATGKFRTAKHNGRWWFVDPDGYLFWSTGVNSACRLDVFTPIPGREKYFEFKPNKNDPKYQEFYKKNEFNFGALNLQRKYGTYDPVSYAELGLKRMKNWGFNTLGGWSYDGISSFDDNKKLPYTVSLWTISVPLIQLLPDVFNPKWEENMRNWLKTKADRVKNDPFFIGYFVDNEMHWYDPNDLAKQIIALDPESMGKEVYSRMLYTEYKKIDTFNRIAKSNFASWKEVQNNRKQIEMKAFKDVNIAFYEKLCHRYFSAVRKAINEFSPGNLYLGCRWHVDNNHRNHYNVEVGAEYLDVISFNQYDPEIFNSTFPEVNDIDKPYIVSEFNFGALDRGKFYPGLGWASDQRNRGEKYENFVRTALKQNKCVGAHWFMWGNSTTAGRSHVGENANCGLVSECDQPFYEMLEYMRKANYHVYTHRMNN
jgi:hypothetical protein